MTWYNTLSDDTIKDNKKKHTVFCHILSCYFMGVSLHGFPYRKLYLHIHLSLYPFDFDKRRRAEIARCRILDWCVTCCGPTQRTNPAGTRWTRACPTFLARTSWTSSWKRPAWTGQLGKQHPQRSLNCCKVFMSSFDVSTMGTWLHVKLLLSIVHMTAPSPGTCIVHAQIYTCCMPCYDDMHE